jgi:hypothetical protein
LIFEVYRAHTQVEVTERASELNNEHHFIRAKKTDTHHPLDLRVLGSLKVEARAKH